jgi:hypothetical protein
MNLKTCWAVLLLAIASAGPALAQEPQNPPSESLTPEVTTDKPKPTVTFAKSWEAAVEEAKLLNLPLVIHSHGFY